MNIGKSEAFQLQDKISIHYNIGHLATAHGDTVNPHGNWLIAMNKWSVDRFPTVGTLHPQNFQLIDISDKGAMNLMVDMPIGFSEPHYAQMMAVDKLAEPWVVYPMGTDPLTMEVTDKLTNPGEERIERNGNVVDIYMTAKRSHFIPT